MVMTDYLQLIDTHTLGNRCDVTPLFADHSAFASLVHDLHLRFKAVEFDCVAGVDALGFILGAAIALKTEKGFIPIRKGGKLPVAVDTAFFVDYTHEQKSLELRVGAITPGMKVLLADEWIETGAQIHAAIELIEKQGGVVAGIAAIHIDKNDHTQPLLDTYNCQAIQIEE